MDGLRSTLTTTRTTTQTAMLSGVSERSGVVLREDDRVQPGRFVMGRYPSQGPGSQQGSQQGSHRGSLQSPGRRSRRWLKQTAIAALAGLLSLGFVDAEAWAARSGGRLGGGSFGGRSAPSYNAPSRSSGGSSYGYSGGGMGMPLFMPIGGFGGGFGSLVMVLILLVVLSSLISAFRQVRGGSGQDADEAAMGMGTVTVAQVQVGLLSAARSLQEALNDMGHRADTGTAAGRAHLLQEASLALLRHPEYWRYGKASCQKTPSEHTAEALFNQLSLAERSKFTEETLVNRDGRRSTPDANRGPGALAGAASQPTLAAESSASIDDLSQMDLAGLRAAMAAPAVTTPAATIAPIPPTETAIDPGPGEFILVTLLVAIDGTFDVPSQVTSQDELRQALSRLGSIGSDRLMALEILWTPQADDDALTTDDILTHYADLQLV